MLSNIKEMLSGKELKGQLNELAEQLRQVTVTVKEQTGTMAALKRENEESKAAAVAMTEEIKKSIDAAKDLQEAIRTNMAELKALSTHVQSSIKQKITDELFELTKEVRAKLEGAEKLKQEVTATAAATIAELGKLKSDVTKLSAVAEKIKAEDFELTKFSNQLLAADREKLQLMSRIDTLERLIAKMRRQQ